MNSRGRFLDGPNSHGLDFKAWGFVLDRCPKSPVFIDGNRFVKRNRVCTQEGIAGLKRENMSCTVRVRAQRPRQARPSEKRT